DGAQGRGGLRHRVGAAGVTVDPPRAIHYPPAFGGPCLAYTYGSYLRLDELLSLQTPAAGGAEHDEMLFIVIHQVYELWFKQVLHELDRLRAAFEGGDRPVALATLKRILTIFKTLVAQIDILETMTPVSFSSFRGLLDNASGFQSWQFRE